MFTKFGEKYLLDYLDYFKLNRDKFKGEMLQDYYSLLESYYRQRVFNDDNIRNYDLKLFELYDALFIKNEKSELFSNGQLSHHIFLQAVQTGLRVKEYNWVKSFIQKFNKSLAPVFAKEIYLLCLGLYYFSLKDYQNTILNLNKFTFKSPQYFFLQKILILKAYYEKKDITNYDYEIENLRFYLRNMHELTEEEKTMLRMYYRFFRKLINLKRLSNKNSLKEMIKQTNIFKNEVENERNLKSNKELFLEKIKEIWGKHKLH